MTNRSAGAAIISKRSCGGVMRRKATKRGELISKLSSISIPCSEVLLRRGLFLKKRKISAADLARLIRAAKALRRSKDLKVNRDLNDDATTKPHQLCKLSLLSSEAAALILEGITAKLEDYH